MSIINLDNATAILQSVATGYSPPPPPPYPPPAAPTDTIDQSSAAQEQCNNNWPTTPAAIDPDNNYQRPNVSPL